MVGVEPSTPVAVSHIPPLPVAGAAPSCCGPAAKQRVIIFDWDDTLMSSSWIDREKLLHTDSFAALPADLQARFAALEEQVGRCLSAAAALGNVVVITNAEAGWVEYSSKRFMPRLQPLLEKMRIVSARSTYERFYPGAPLCWKAAAFAHEANQVFSGTSPEAVREIISIGDSNEERTAVKIAAGQLDATSKSIKFVDSPDPEQLCKQVETICSWLEWLCGYRSELDCMLIANSPGLAPVDMNTTNVQSSPWRPPRVESLTQRT